MNGACACGRQKNGPKEFHALILRDGEYVTFYGKRDSADRTEVKDLEMRDYSRLSR